VAILHAAIRVGAGVRTGAHLTTLPVYQPTVIDAAGFPAEGAAVTIRDPATDALVTVYAVDSETTMAQPLTADGKGRVRLRVVPGVYDVVAETSRGSDRLNSVEIS